MNCVRINPTVGMNVILYRAYVNHSICSKGLMFTVIYYTRFVGFVFTRNHRVSTTRERCIHICTHTHYRSTDATHVILQTEVSTTIPATYYTLWNVRYYDFVSSQLTSV